MKEFTDNPVCPKCGSADIGWTYLPPDKWRKVWECKNTRQHHCLHCHRCHFKWDMKVKPGVSHEG